MKRDFLQLVNRFGSPVSLETTDGTFSAMAFVQPLRKQDEQILPTPLGRRRQEQFLCLAEPNLPLDSAGENAVLSFCGTQFRIVTSRLICNRATPAFHWAVLEPLDPEVVYEP